MLPCLSLAISLAMVAIISFSSYVAPIGAEYCIAYYGGEGDVLLPYIDAVSIDYIYLIKTAIRIFLLANIPTAILLAIHYGYRKVLKKTKKAD